MIKERNKMCLVEDTQDGDGSILLTGEFDADLNWYEIDPSLGSDRLLDYLTVSASKNGIAVAGNSVSFTLDKDFENDQACLKYIEENIKAPIDPEELVRLGFKNNK